MCIILDSTSFNVAPRNNDSVPEDFVNFVSWAGLNNFILSTGKSSGSWTYKKKWWDFLVWFSVLTKKHFKENHVILYVFLYDVIFLVFVFLRFLCKFSIISELSFMQWSLYCTILHYATLHFFQLLKKHRFCIHFFSWGLSDPKWPRNNKNNRFLKKKFHDPRETQKFCFLATCHKSLHTRGSPCKICV